MRCFSLQAAIAYMAMALPSALLLALALPPFQAPDEIDHYFHARYVARGGLIPTPVPGVGSGGVIDHADFELVAAFHGIAAHPTVRANRRMFDVAADVKKGLGKEFHAFPGSAIYPPFAYFAPALGLKLADEIGLTRLQAFYVGRIANALLALIGAAAAIWLIPWGRWVLAFVFLLPMFIAQSASYSADATIFMLSGLALALIVHCAANPSARANGLMAAALIVAAVSSIRAPMVGLALPLAATAWLKNKRFAVVCLVLAVAPAVLWSVYTRTWYVDERLKLLEGFGAARQLSYLLEEPWRVLPLAWNTIGEQSSFYIASMVGVLGWLDTWLENWFYHLSYWLFAALLLGAVSERASLPSFVRAALVVGALIALALVFAGLYLVWTPVGSPIVMGVQGRYFLPIVPLLVVAACGSYTTDRLGSLRLLGPGIVWGFYAIAMIHTRWVILRRYYLQ